MFFSPLNTTPCLGSPAKFLRLHRLRQRPEKTSLTVGTRRSRFLPNDHLNNLTMVPPKRGISPGKPKSSSSGPKISLARVKGENFYRTGKQVARLKLLNSGKAVRDKDGKIIQAAAFQKGENETKPGRVQPDRRWFGMYFVYYICSGCHFV